MATAGNPHDLGSDAEHRRQLRRAVIASTIGTTIEWYDFFLYGMVTGLVFAKLYFPQAEPLIGTLQAFAIYAVGFVARPVGAAIFGHYGDRIGRKKEDVHDRRGHDRPVRICVLRHARHDDSTVDLHRGFRIADPA